MRLVGYEIKKALSNGYSIILIAVLLAANVVFACISYNENADSVPNRVYLDEVFELYREDPDLFWSEYERINEEDFKSFFSGGDMVSDYGGGEEYDSTLFSYVERCILRDGEYHDDLHSVIAQANGLMYTLNAASEENVNSYAYRYQAQVAAVYSKLDDNVTLSDDVIEGWDAYITYQSDLIFAAASVLIVVILVATNDYYSGFYAIEKACAKGREHTAYAKFAAVMILSSALTAVFYASNLISAFAALDFSSSSLPIQMVDRYEMCPFEISIWQFIILSVVIKVLAAALFSGILMAVLSVFRRFSFGVVGGGSLIALSYFLSKADITTFGQIKYLNYWSFYNLEDILSRYRAVNIFGFSVSIMYVALFAFILVTGIALFIHCRAFSTLGGVKRVSRRRERKSERARSKDKTGVSIPLFKSLHVLFYEQYKRAWIIPVFVIAVILKLFTAADYYSYENYTYMRNYRAYMEVIEGEYNAEKHDYLSAEMAECEEIIAKYSEMEELFITGEFPTNYYLEYTREYSAATAKKTVLEDLIEKADYLAGLYSRGIVGSFINEIDYSVYLERGTDWTLTVCILLFGVSSFTMERKRTSSSESMMFLIGTTSKGRFGTFIAKYIVSAGYSALMFIIFTVIELVFYAKSLTVPSSGALLISLDGYEDVSSSVTIGQHFVFMMITSFIGVLLMVTFCFLLSYLLKDGNTAYILSALIMLAPGFLESVGVGFFCYFDINKFKDTEALYKLSLELMKTGVYIPFALAFVIFAGLILVMAVFTSRKVRSGGR